jgi:hypothetical protein
VRVGFFGHIADRDSLLVLIREILDKCKVLVGVVVLRVIHYTHPKALLSSRRIVEPLEVGQADVVIDLT